MLSVRYDNHATSQLTDGSEPVEPVPGPSVEPVEPVPGPSDRCPCPPPADVAAEHHDGAEEVLQPPVPLPRGLRRGAQAAQRHVRDRRRHQGQRQARPARQDAGEAEIRGPQVS